MFSDTAFWQALSNTIIITLLQLVFYFPAPIVLALLLQGVISTKVRRIIQSVVYLPHFISWVIVVSLWQQVLGGSGIFVHTLRDLGLPAINVMTEPGLFKGLVTSQLIWKETGYATIIFLAALLNIEAALYEAAVMDGAGRWQRLWNITLPGILGVVILLLILRLGLALSVGFEQILLQRNAVGPAAGEVLDTYVYFKGIVGGQWGITAAAGLDQGHRRHGPGHRGQQARPSGRPGRRLLVIDAGAGSWRRGRPASGPPGWNSETALRADRSRSASSPSSSSPCCTRS